jgi:hypothetical protein
MPEFFFWPAVVLIGVVVIVVSAKFLFRIALFMIAFLLIWYCLYIVGLAPSPIRYFDQFSGVEKESSQFFIKKLKDI